MIDDEAAQLVEVLPREDFEAEHIAGAANLPLKDINAETVRQLDGYRPVIVYCDDFQ
jgi:rhodanese-related sulfurtransferase